MKRQLIYVLIVLLAVTGACRKSENLSDHSYQSEKLTKGELITLKSGVVVEKRGNEIFFLGDILLSEKQYKLLGETGTIFSENSYDTSKKMPLNSILLSPKSGSHYFQTTSPRSVGLSPYQNMFWSMVRYTRNNNLSYTSRYYIDEAIAHWEATTNVRFYDATGEPTVDPTYGFAYPYVEFVEAVGNVSSSQVGRLGGKQTLKVAQVSSIGTVIHEIGHAIGLFHEQNKPGRNNYINVDLNNVIDSFKHNFQEVSGNYYAIGAGIDFGSIMMYHPKDFAINTSTEVITKKDGSSYLSQYQRDGLSLLDRAFANTFYLPYKARYDTYRELDDIVYKPDNTVMTPQERLNLQASLNNGNPNPPFSPPIESSPLYEYYNSVLKDSYYDMQYFPSGAGGGGWIFRKISCYVYASQVTSQLVPVYSYWNSGITDHYYTQINQPSLGGGGWLFEILRFYAFNSSASNLVPVYSYYCGSTVSHALSVDKGAFINIDGHTYTRENIAFYAYPNPN